MYGQQTKQMYQQLQYIQALIQPNVNVNLLAFTLS